MLSDLLDSFQRPMKSSSFELVESLRELMKRNPLQDTFRFLIRSILIVGLKVNQVAIGSREIQVAEFIPQQSRYLLHRPKPFPKRLMNQTLKLNGLVGRVRVVKIATKHRTVADLPIFQLDIQNLHNIAIESRPIMKRSMISLLLSCNNHNFPLTRQTNVI